MSFRKQIERYRQWKVENEAVSLQNDHLKQAKATIYHIDHIHPLVCIPASKPPGMAQAATSAEKYTPTNKNIDTLYLYMCKSSQPPA